MQQANKEVYTFRKTLTTPSAQDSMTGDWKKPSRLDLAYVRPAMQRTILAVREYMETRLLPIIDQWREHRRLFNAKSSNLLFMDLETSWGPPPGQDYGLIFQNCIWDAAQHEIVYAKISQAMPVETLYNLKADAQRKPKLGSGTGHHQAKRLRECHYLNSRAYSKKKKSTKTCS